MTLAGIAHAVGTAASQVCATTAAHGLGTVAAGHYANIAGALGGWVAAGITPEVVIGAGVGVVAGIATYQVIKYIEDKKKEPESEEDNEYYTYDIFDKTKRYYKYLLNDKNNDIIEFINK